MSLWDWEGQVGYFSKKACQVITFDYRKVEIKKADHKKGR
jgi:hypothetical protein